MWAEQLLHDCRYAWRGLMQSRLFAATTVFTLAIGIGLVTVAFTVFDAYVLRPFAVNDPSRLHGIGWRSRDNGGQSFSWRDYEALRSRRDLLDGLIAERTRFVSSDGRSLAAAYVSENYFSVLAPRFLAGRGLTPSDTSTDVAVLGYQAWVRLAGNAPPAVGRRLDLNGRPVEIVGILQPEFTGIDDMPRDIWLPMTEAESARGVKVVARLRPTVTPAQAQSALTPFVADVIGRREADVRAEVTPQSTRNRLTFGLLAVLSPVFAAFALVLVTACANVSNVMLARAVTRHREIAVRLSIGASRGRIVRQLLTEGLVIAALSGVAGLLLAQWTIRAGIVLIFRTLPPSVAAILRVVPLTIDLRVFAFALLVSSFATLMFALLPALHAAAVNLTDALKGTGSGLQRGSRMRNVLVAGQVAVSVVLVVVALTLARSGAAIGSIALGYSTAGVTSINVRGEDERHLVAKLASQLAADPRVGEVAGVGGTPLIIRTRAMAAAPADAAVKNGTRYTFVTPEYFSILRIPILRGRGFRADEAQGSAPIAIVSANTASAFWPGEDPVGKTIRIEPPDGRPVDDVPGYRYLAVVGVVPDVVSGILIDGLDAGHIYLPTDTANPHATALMVRGRAERDLSPGALQEIFKRVDSDPERFEALPLEEMRALQIYPLRAASWIGSLLGMIALVLSVSGLYGVLTYTLSQRTREIGIRMALGATATAVVGMVMRQCARIAVTGAAIGLAVTTAVMVFLGSQIHVREVSFVDFAAFAAGISVVLVATAVAAYQPARRATLIDPAEALRNE
jgi:predicted permease